MQSCGPLFLLALALASPAAAQDSVAVLAVDTSALTPSAGDPVVPAEAIREELTKAGVTVLSAGDTSRRLRSMGISGSYSLDTYNARLQDAEDAYAALDTQRSIEILEAVLQDLASDADFSPEKQTLLERSRVRAAERLMGLAGPDEKGEGATPLGQRARSHLVAALRTNPSMALSQQEHPPKLHRLLARAQETLAAGGQGTLRVESVPAGAAVFVEGREVGRTPLSVEALPRGRHRVWLTLEPTRSVTRWVEVGPQPVELEVDLAFEGALWSSGPGLRPVSGQTINEAVASKVAALLGASELVLVGFASYDDARWLYGVVYGSEEGTARQTVRRGAVRLAAAAPSDDDIARLGGFLWSGEGGTLDPAAVPASVLPGGSASEAAATSSAATEGDMGVLLWTGLGIGAGALVVGALSAGAIAALALSSASPPDPVGHFDVEVVP